MLPSTSAVGPAKGDRGDRRGGIGADAGEGAQIRLFARKSAAPASNFPGAGVQVSRPRIITETRECADHGFDRGGGEILDPRPFCDERPIIGRRRLGRRLLQQYLGEPDPVRIGRLPRSRTPGEGAAIAIHQPSVRATIAFCFAFPPSALTLAPMRFTPCPMPKP